ncbi:hypothetical protein SAMN04488011_109106 [Palleronia pelagia]|uniref:Uncharacterized protein n=1 Tax=Palleronia pelagia TaxID=387096 RepID=A0A1H8L6J3_9RHOB|nr:hypothetical protein SAMN04488011_109106 [Palleronia pelagia]
MWRRAPARTRRRLSSAEIAGWRRPSGPCSPRTAATGATQMPAFARDPMGSPSRAADRGFAEQRADLGPPPVPQRGSARGPAARPDAVAWLTCLRHRCRPDSRRRVAVLRSGPERPPRRLTPVGRGHARRFPTGRPHRRGQRRDDPATPHRARAQKPCRPGRARRPLARLGRFSRRCRDVPHHATFAGRRIGQSADGNPPRRRVARRTGEAELARLAMRLSRSEPLEFRPLAADETPRKSLPFLYRHRIF